MRWLLPVPPSPVTITAVAFLRVIQRIRMQPPPLGMLHVVSRLEIEVVARVRLSGGYHAVTVTGLTTAVDHV